MTFEIELKIKFNGDYVFNREKGIITIENDKIIGNIGNDLIYGVYKRNIMYPLLYSDNAFSFYKDKYLFTYPSLSSSNGTIYENDTIVGKFSIDYMKKIDGNLELSSEYHLH